MVIQHPVISIVSIVNWLRFSLLFEFIPTSSSRLMTSPYFDRKCNNTPIVQPNPSCTTYSPACPGTPIYVGLAAVLKSSDSEACSDDPDPLSVFILHPFQLDHPTGVDDVAGISSELSG